MPPIPDELRERFDTELNRPTGPQAKPGQDIELMQALGISTGR